MTRRPLLTMSEGQLNIARKIAAHGADHSINLITDLLAELDAQRAETPREPVEDARVREAFDQAIAAVQAHIDPVSGVVAKPADLIFRLIMLRERDADIQDALKRDQPGARGAGENGADLGESRRGR